MDKGQVEKHYSQLRLDPVSNDWVVIAVGRAMRPEDFSKNKREKIDVSEADCVFCNIATQSAPVLEYKNEKDEWQLVVIPNKYPAFSVGNELRKEQQGPYETMNAIGHHEVIIIRDHKKTIAEMSTSEVKLIIDAYQSRYLSLKDKKFVNYISIFNNYGKEAGASIVHPHSQLMAIPIIDPDLNRSLEGSKKYMDKHGQCVHCAMIEWDITDKKRIVFENKEFVVLCPFASRSSFEVRIYPKVHSAYFEKIDDQNKQSLAEALREAIQRIFEVLGDPAYNFFLHTAPCDGGVHDHYHWHLEIMPKTGTWAGFELGTGIEISTLEPDKAAEFLRLEKNV
ncbi:MAG: galactose-1-phosphate uridylyltransferase [Candidatus Portnoybacteria bacterium CG10_big_fil_rev_8_21_14_0_10_36_7]|uniref:Galactose-1-phosphate uridylyltransferase n=1 Tax=Candidatus Portnoybacteria bacterium CG10_big_fil_rev_8_21_14_0_10_36_7 TaxID=1974812 RepID=A0A2M8KDA3_9BACT|nr:MAG: galactose-1-phosphate uridylyltransferase [Candidatus Portnoybacteria bacterium CG10_big_fil_rev_8_21_14_0_10_36_7]